MTVLEDDFDSIHYPENLKKSLKKKDHEIEKKVQKLNKIKEDSWVNFTPEMSRGLSCYLISGRKRDPLVAIDISLNIFRDTKFRKRLLAACCR